jgi:nitrous oxidase accessory protein NosD
MSGDYSRHRFNPRNHYAGVKMQQGRVQLDADWNEWTDLIDRHARAETVDTFGVFPSAGIGGVAVVSPQTPDAFRIEASGGNLSIGPGRMYVDGLLAENFGDDNGPQNFDRVLAELSGQNPVSYMQQPYHPAPDNLPTGGPHLAYLEVWQREINHLQRPDLVEKAIGVDTTTRTQTVWQVRLLENISSSITCSSPDADLGLSWEEIITPSAGRLTSRDVGVPPDSDPCELPPSGGYRGLENQLYRIEIHHGGDIGDATFKWSRDNASVAASVVEVVSATKLKLASLGRDSVLRFNTGDWVEIVDDWYELSGAGGNPKQRIGEIRKVTVDDASQTISFSPALPASLIPAESGDNTLEKRHLRVIRWDQKGVVRDQADNVIVDLDAPGSQGLIPVPAAGTWVTLENGVQVRFDLDPAAGSFRCNDFWNIAARTVDASAEHLSEAPPQGIHRHYTRLALLTFPNGETDCRKHWPPDCDGGCCTVTVKPGDDIQAAIDSLSAIGGCVCIKTGLHEITNPLRIENSNIMMHAESAGARIRRNNGASVLQVESPKGATLENVTIQGVRFETVSDSNARDRHPLIMVFSNRCSNFRLEDCVLLPDRFNFVTGVWIGSLQGGSIERCEIGPLGLGIWVSSESTGLDVYDCNIYADYFDGVDAGSVGIWLEDAYKRSRIERNDIRNFMSGVYINRAQIGDPPVSGANGSTVIGNRIMRNSNVGGSDDNQHLFAIEYAASHGTVSDNILDYASAAYGGIRVTGRHVLIENNRLNSHLKGGSDGTGPLPLGIQLGYVTEDVAGPGDGGMICGNILKGTQDGIITVGAGRAKITSNQIEGGEAMARYGIATVNGDDIEIAENDSVRTAFALSLGNGENCSLTGNRADDGRLGVLAIQQAGLSVHGNRVTNQRNGGMMLASVAGPTSITENRIEACGFEGLGTLGATGILMMGAAGHVHIGSCEIIDTGVSPDQSQVKQPAYGIFGLYWLECLVQSNRVSYVNPALEQRNQKAEDRALWLIGFLDYQVTDNLRFGFAAQVLDNKFTGPGRSHLVEFQQQQLSDRAFLRFERITFSNNYCWHWSVAADDSAGTVSLHGHRAIVMGNHVKANTNIPSFNFNGMSGVYLGNDATGPVTGFSDFPTPSSNFNR